MAAEPASFPRPGDFGPGGGPGHAPGGLPKSRTPEGPTLAGNSVPSVFHGAFPHNGRQERGESSLPWPSFARFPPVATGAILQASSLSATRWPSRAAGAEKAPPWGLTQPGRGGCLPRGRQGRDPKAYPGWCSHVQPWP